MGLTNPVKDRWIEIINWTDDARDILVYRFPDKDREIKRGAQLTVRQSEMAQLVYLGQFGDLLGPGQHTLSTDTIQVLSRLRGWNYGLELPFKADVFFVNTQTFIGNKWGTANSAMVRERVFDAGRLSASGTYDFRIVDVQRFLKEIAGTDEHLHLNEFVDIMQSRILIGFSEALAAHGIPASETDSRYRELGAELLPSINPAMHEKYGIELTSFAVENLSVLRDVKRTVDRRSGRAAFDSRSDYL